MAEYHTYFVGEAGAWVHNSCSDPLGIADADYAKKRVEHNVQIGVTRKTQIVGSHNEDSFLETADIVGAKLGDKFESNKYSGLMQYAYELPKRDRAGNLIGGYKKLSTRQYILLLLMMIWSLVCLLLRPKKRSKSLMVT